MTLTLHLYGKDGIRKEVSVHSRPIKYFCFQESIGLTYFIVPEDKLPVHESEPELWENARYVDYLPQNINPEEIILHYRIENPRDIAKVVFITHEAYNRFREEDPEIILQDGLFRIDF